MDLSHTDDQGRARMVDVSQKDISRRTAQAEATVFLSPDTISLITSNSIKKGDVLSVAKTAGIQAAKQTSSLIPMCHPLFPEHIKVEFDTHKESITIHTQAVCTAKTGIEMEALTAASVAALTVYDMCKAVDRSMRIGNIKLISKSKTSPAEDH